MFTRMPEDIFRGKIPPPPKKTKKQKTNKKNNKKKESKFDPND